MTYVPHRQVRFNLYLFHYHFSIYLYSSSQHLFQIPFVVIIQIQNLVDFNQTISNYSHQSRPNDCLILNIETV